MQRLSKIAGLNTCNVIVLVFLNLLMQGCVSAFASPYVNPSEGHIFKYGKFCGPKVPPHQLSKVRKQRIAYLSSITPIDSIDEACKVHDLCYARFGDDNASCDTTMVTTLVHLGRNSAWKSAPNLPPAPKSIPMNIAGFILEIPQVDRRTSSPCNSLVHEIMTAFSTKIKNIRGQSETRTTLERIWGTPWAAGMIASSLMPDSWPDEGTCSVLDTSKVYNSNVIYEYKSAATSGGCSEKELLSGKVNPAICGIKLSLSEASQINSKQIRGLAFLPSDRK